MAFADDLIEQARHLARREKKKPKQASLRRAVSTAYYALFHLLIADAVASWKRIDQRAELARAFEHAKMKSASQRVAGSPFPNQDPRIAGDLKKVARTFSRLQDYRHAADYDGATRWSRTQVSDVIEMATEAFQSWRRIRTEEIAQAYLLSLLIKVRA